MMKFHIRPVRKTDKTWIDRTLLDRWGSRNVVTRGVLHVANELPGFIAEVEKRLVGLLTYRLDDTSCEVISLDSFMGEVAPSCSGAMECTSVLV